MRELIIANNMIALARSKHGNKRSAMLRMIMPFLSRETGDKLSTVIADADSQKFAHIWDKVKHEIMHKLAASRHPKHKATAADVSTFTHGMEDLHVNVNTYNGESVRIILNGLDLANVPACEPSKPTKISVSMSTEDTGCVYEGSTTNDQLIALIKFVCEALINKEDPCPLEEPQPPTAECTESKQTPLEELCARLIALAKI